MTPRTGSQTPPSSSAQAPARTRTPRRRPSGRPLIQLPISERRLLLIVGDLVATVSAVTLALAVWAHNAHEPFDQTFIIKQAHWYVILPLAWFLLAESNDYYNLRVSAQLRSSFLRLTVIISELLIIYLATFFLSPRGSLPRRFILYYAIISLVLTGLWRGCRLFLIGWTGFRRRVLIAGTGQAAQIIFRALKDEAHGDYEVVGFVTSVYDSETTADDPAAFALSGAPAPLGATPPPPPPTPTPTRSPQSLLPILGTGSALPDLVSRHGIVELVMAYVNEVPEDIFSGALAAYEQGAQITPMTALYEQITGRVPIEQVGEHLWTLVLPVEPRTLAAVLYFVVKRLLDCVCAVVGLILFGLLLPLLALAITLDSPGPVVYRQRRLGRGGRVFSVYKLRTMIVGAESASGPQWAEFRDRRITRVGRVLRKLRLDEAPQLLNVLRDEMSIVGPRPERPEFVQQLSRQIPYYRARLAVKPGLTGWAQVRYRYGNTIDDVWRKLQYDLYYIRHQSLALDISIMLRTIGTVLLLRGT